MSFGFNTNPFEGNGLGYAGQNVKGLADHNSKAVLFIFRGHDNQFGDVGMRPFQYAFDDNFLSDTQEITDLTKNGSASHGALLNQFMNKTNFSDHMIASYEPRMMFNASRLSDKWRFILVLTEKASGLIGDRTMAASLGSNQIRRIYTGYFMDEPFNPTTLTETRKTPNPHAFMVFTHKTVVGTASEHGQYGSRMSVNTRASEEIINSNISSALMGHENGTDATIHLMTPSNCVNSIETTSDGFAMAVPGAFSDITRDRGHHVLADTLEQPTHNVSQIIKGMMKHQDDVTHRGRLMTGRGVDAFYENDLTEDSNSRMNLGRWMDVPRFRPIGNFDLDLDTKYSAIEISNLVGGDLDVIDFDQQRPQFYDTADQMQADMTNQYSYLIAMVIVPILNAAGLNAIQFIYEVKRTQGQVMDQFTPISAEPHWATPPEEVAKTVVAVKMELIKGIFKTIFDSKGDFHVEVDANATGMTIVRLNLIGQGCRCLADFEIPSCLGGLISPLIGDSRTNATNSEMITGLYSAASGTGSGIKAFDQDDLEFMKLGENLPQIGGNSQTPFLKFG